MTRDDTTGYSLLESATDAAVMIQELQWKKDSRGDEELAPEFTDMYQKLRQLSQRSLREPLQHTDPLALFNLVRYAKHLGMWRGYHANQHRVQYVEGLGDDTTDDDHTRK